jgi:hypothetical protein
MQFSKTTFILLLAAIFVLPFFIGKLVWLYNSASATGAMCFMGKTQNGQFSSTYPVIKFSSNGKDTIFFNGNDGMECKRGDLIPVRFQKKNPADARVNEFTGIWVDTIVYAGIPFTILLIIFFHPDLIPRKSKIVIGKKPFIQLTVKAKK